MKFAILLTFVYRISCDLQKRETSWSGKADGICCLISIYFYIGQGLTEQVSQQLIDYNNNSYLQEQDTIFSSINSEQGVNKSFTNDLSSQTDVPLQGKER